MYIRVHTHTHTPSISSDYIVPLYTEIILEKLQCVYQGHEEGMGGGAEGLKIKMSSFSPWKCNTFFVSFVFFFLNQNLFQSKLSSVSSIATIVPFSFHPHACRLHHRNCIKDKKIIP